MVFNYSVLMSVYNKEKPEYLEKSILSILNQTVKTNNFVIVCDGLLSDELYAVLDKYQQANPSVFEIIKYDTNKGLGYALNTGLAHVKNEIVMRMDSDDISSPQRAEKQLPLMDKYDLVGSWVNEFENEENNVIATRKTKEFNQEIHKFAKKRCPFNHPSVMFKKTAILDSGGYQTLLYVEDYFLWVRVLLGNKTVYNIQEPLVNMRSGVQMRARRGGKIYKKSISFLRKFMYKNGFINFVEYVWLSTIQNIFLSMPLFIKTLLYKYLLRR